MPRRQWLYLGRAAPDTTVDQVLHWVNNELNIADAKCEILASNDDIRSFKLGVKEDVLKSLLDPGKWPSNIAVKEFIPRKGSKGTFRQGP